MEITFEVPTSFDDPIPLETCVMQTSHINEKTNETEYDVYHNEIDDKYIKFYNPGEVFTIEYDLEIERNSFPKNGKYIWKINPCICQQKGSCRRFPSWCIYYVSAELTFTLGKAGIMEGKIQNISNNLLSKQ